MSDDGFKETLRMLAEGTMSWHDEHIVLLYNEAEADQWWFVARSW